MQIEKHNDFHLPCKCKKMETEVLFPLKVTLPKIRCQSSKENLWCIWFPTFFIKKRHFFSQVTFWLCSALSLSLGLTCCKKSNHSNISIRYRLWQPNQTLKKINWHIKIAFGIIFHQKDSNTSWAYINRLLSHPWSAASTGVGSNNCDVLANTAPHLLREGKKTISSWNFRDKIWMEKAEIIAPSGIWSKS